MTLDLGHEPDDSYELVGSAADRHRTIETWSLTGSDGDPFLVDAHIPADVERVVVMAHGVDNSRKARYIEVSAKRFSSSNIAVIAMDAPRHGDRPGAAPIEGPVGASLDVLVDFVRDHRRLIDVVAQRWPDVPIGFAGFSMGGSFGVPLLAVEERLQAGAIVIAGSTMVSYPIRFGKLDRLTRERIAVSDPAVHAPRVGERRVLMINADRDELVPTEAAQALYEAFPGPKELVFMEGTHTEWGHAVRWFRRLETFFLEALRI